MLQSTVDVPGSYSAAGVDQAEKAPEVAWWKAYGDPVLADLIERAAIQNRDVRIAAERVRAARAGERISRSALLPSVGLSAGATRSTNGYEGAAQGAVPEMKSSSAGLDVSWEIDLSGRLRDGAKAAAADVTAAQGDARGVRLLVLTEVASHYFSLTGALRQLETLQAISKAQDETLRLVTARQSVGLASQFDVERARADAERAHADIPPLQTLVAVSRHRIAALMGDTPEMGEKLVPWNGTVTAPEISPGQPATLLERRPDLLASRAQLESANWHRRQAATEWFPRLFTSALFGSQDVQVNGASLGAARFGNVAGLLTMPLLNWGRTKAINDAAGADQNAAVLRYEDAIVRALEDVENALVASKDGRQRAASMTSAADAADAALRHARSLYDRGQIDLLPLLDAQRAQLQARLGANDSQTELLLDSVRVFKALGGGWEAFEPGAPRSAASTGTPAIEARS
ncbi:TolC family protein [Lysobacter sp. KIS68-7]|uniref:efflux transporter outer membrane subunit n=1 Tax=Lysobacter sp. KIS68-7 TaxID=2904252 RepID=UPI001E50FFB9|nr:TolC family protein [Lysobacter sp. KIS68-7]UHQ19384.1 TolC family protein [Lysobacter sp. KIS68-7]